MSDFKELVWRACQKISKGRVSTYKEIARVIGLPKAARAVGNALNKNPNTKLTPCYRVVQSSGFVGGYAQGTKNKIARLKKEGIIVSSTGRIDLSKFFIRL